MLAGALRSLIGKSVKVRRGPAAVKMSKLHYATGITWEGEASNESEPEELPENSLTTPRERRR